MKKQINIFLIAILMLSLNFSTGAMEERTELGQELIESATDGALEKVKSLIKSGAPVNEKNQWGLTALMEAALNGEQACCEALLESGAAVNEKNGSGWTALIYAARWGEQACCETLLKYGALINEKEKDGWTALMCAAENNQLCCELLVEVMLGICPLHTEEASATLFCMKEIQNNKTNTDNVIDLMEPIAQRLCFAQKMSKEDALAEVNRIENEPIKKALIKKYFTQEVKSN